MMLKLLVLIFAVSWKAHGCHPALKHFDEGEVIFCSSMFSTGITWLFNNQSEVGPGVVVSQGGRSIIIPASDKSVYGDYSCFQNNRFVNCSSLYISGECNITCAGLKTDIENTTSTYLIGSTITLYLTVTINLSPRDYSQGSFILYKDGIALQRENVTYNRESFTYHLFNAQPTDTGIYYAEHISENAMLITNRLFINATNITNYNPTASITSKNLTSSLIIANTGTVNIGTTDMSPQAPTATANGNDDSSKTVSIAVGVSVAVLLVIGLVVVVIIATIVVIHRRKKANDNNSSIPIEETHR